MTPRKIGQKPPTPCRLAQIAILAIMALAFAILAMLMRVAFQR